MAILGFNHVPTCIGKKACKFFNFHSGYDTVEALAVGVNDPHHVAKTLQRRIGDGLPNVALVKFGVADKGNETRGWSSSEVCVYISANH